MNDVQRQSTAEESGAEGRKLCAAMRSSESSGQSMSERNSICHYLWNMLRVIVMMSHDYHHMSTNCFGCLWA